MFFNEPEAAEFFTVMRGSNLICAKTYIKEGEFLRVDKSKCRHKLTFIDSLNYASMSVEKMGKILNLPKLDKPRSLGRLPMTDDEKNELITYNIRDAEISKKFIDFIFKGFEELGAIVEMTIASTAMKLFRTKYLKDVYYRHEIDDLKFQFKGYYGGRTEAFGRGKIENYNYYDFNSLYPSVMHDCVYPNPNTLRRTFKNTLNYINHFEGVSEVIVSVPKMEYPPLPLRHDDKLTFPTGQFKGVFTHVELRYAMTLGVKIKHVLKTIYFTDTCTPFKEFVQDLYSKRLKYKDEGSEMQLVTKLLMNSLYGKFGQKFENKDQMLPENVTYEELMTYDKFERVGNYFRVSKDVEPSLFCIPIWAAYVTAHARIKLHKSMLECQPVYVDTDSMITTKTMIDGIKLGELELEYKIKEAYIVKPKFYAVKYWKGNQVKEFVKIKGIGCGLNYEQFITILDDPVVSYMKFMKFKEGIRRDILPNLIVEVKKHLSLEDNKRKWGHPFNKEFQLSQPLHHEIDMEEYKSIKEIRHDHVNDEKTNKDRIHNSEG